MKKRIVVMMSLMLLLALVGVSPEKLAAKETVLKINSTNFPDLAFQYFITDNIDLDHNKVLSSSEINKVVEMNLFFHDIIDLTGIEHFTKLESISFARNQMEKVDLTNNKALKAIDIYGKQAEKINFGAIKSLESITIHDYYKPVDLSKNKALKILSLENARASINLKENVNLEIFEIDNEALEYDYKIDLSNCRKLKELRLKSLYARKPIYLSKDCKIELLDADGLTLSKLNIDSFPNLVSFSCYSPYDHGEVAFVKRHPKLKEINVSVTSLDGLDFSNHKQLNKLSIILENKHVGGDVLDLSHNQLHSLCLSVPRVNLGSQPQLSYLKLYNVDTPIDYRLYPNLEELYISDIDSTINLEKNQKLKRLEVSACPGEIHIPNNNDISYLEAINLNEDKFSNNIDVKALKNIKKLRLVAYDVSDVDFSQFKKLMDLDIDECKAEKINLQNSHQLSKLEIYDPNRTINSLQFADTNKLESVSISGTRIEELDMKSSEKMKKIYLSDVEHLRKFDVGQYSTLNEFELRNSSLREVDVSKNKRLKTLSLSELFMTCLDISDFTYLESLDINDCYFGSINLKNTPRLKEIKVDFSTILDADFTSKHLAEMNCGVNEVRFSNSENVVLNVDDKVEAVCDCLRTVNAHIVISQDNFDIREILPHFDSSRVSNLLGAKMKNSRFYDFTMNEKIEYDYDIGKDVFSYKEAENKIHVVIHVLYRNPDSSFDIIKNTEIPYQGRPITLKDIVPECYGYNSGLLKVCWQEKTDGVWHDVESVVKEGKYRFKLADSTLKLYGSNEDVDWIEFMVVNEISNWHVLFPLLGLGVLLIIGIGIFYRKSKANLKLV